MLPEESDRAGKRQDVIVVEDEKGALSMELVPVGESVARAFLRFSPRGLRLSHSGAARLSEELLRRPYSKLLVQDNRKQLLRRSLPRVGWSVSRAVEPKLTKRCAMVSSVDVPLDADLVDCHGCRPDFSNTTKMDGIRVELGDRLAWAFYTDDGETARLILDEGRRQGLLVASRPEDFADVVECLIRFLASTGKAWAVFSADLGRFITAYYPIVMWRMVLERPVAYDHKAEPFTWEIRSRAVRLFSEYYDESALSSLFRLRRLLADRNYSLFLVDGGFVITKAEGDTGLVFDIYVTPARQGEGFGEELLKAALSHFAGRVSSCYLHTSYPRARRLYEKFGFRVAHAQLGIRLDESLFLRPGTSQSLPERPYLRVGPQ